MNPDMEMYLFGTFMIVLSVLPLAIGNYMQNKRRLNASLLWTSLCLLLMANGMALLIIAVGSKLAILMIANIFIGVFVCLLWVVLFKVKKWKLALSASGDS